MHALMLSHNIQGNNITTSTPTAPSGTYHLVATMDKILEELLEEVIAYHRT
jgi:hypothetical protein